MLPHAVEHLDTLFLHLQKFCFKTFQLHLVLGLEERGKWGRWRRGAEGKRRKEEVRGRRDEGEERSREGERAEEEKECERERSGARRQKDKQLARVK